MSIRDRRHRFGIAFFPRPPSFLSSLKPDSTLDRIIANDVRAQTSIDFTTVNKDFRYGFTILEECLIMSYFSSCILRDSSEIFNIFLIKNRYFNIYFVPQISPFSGIITSIV